MVSSRHRRAELLVLVFTGLGAGPVGVVPSNPGSSGGGLPPESDAVVLTDGSELWFVEMPDPPTADGGDPAAIERDLDQFRATASAAGVRFRERRVFETLWSGVSIALNREDRAKLARLSGIAGIAPVVAVEPDLLTSRAMVGADVARDDLGLTGAGIRVGIIDTGVDYDHPDLGGDGVERANSSAFPNARIVAGYDFVGDAFTGSNEAIPDPYPDDCTGHGTHVTGIVGAEGAMRGVAPSVVFGAYRVFGCTGFVPADIVVAALERALADGMQVVNLSLGSAGRWPQDPMAAAADRLVNSGVVVVAAQGNAASSGLYFVGSPAVGQKVIGVGAFDNTHMHLSAFSLSPDDRLFGYLVSNTNVPPPSGSYPMTRTGSGSSLADACSPLPAGSLSGSVALIRRGTCPYETKALNAERAGATGVVIYNNVTGFGDPPGPGFPGDATIPVVGISRVDGLRIDGRLIDGPVTLTWGDGIVSEALSTGGLIYADSSYGPTPDLSLKPDIAAPGGFVRSTVPIEQGRYAVYSGTSMATPHVTGAVALLLEARPHTPSNAVRTILQNHAVPHPFKGDPALLESVQRQGAGMLDVAATVRATTRVEPGKLELGEIESGSITRTIEVTNESAWDVTYVVSHRPAVATGPNTFTPVSSASAATVVANPNPLIVPAGSALSLELTITPPAGLGEHSLFGGYVTLMPQNGGRESSVPYLGFVGDYQAIPVLTPHPPTLAHWVGGSLVRLATGATFSMVDRDRPVILYHLDHPVAQLTFEVFDADTGRSWHRIERTKWVRRNTTAAQEFVLEWDGSTESSGRAQTVPDGRYVIRLTILKALAEPGEVGGTAIWTSPVVTLERPAPVPDVPSPRKSATLADCYAWMGEYDDAIREASVCRTEVRREQCTLAVDGSLVCPCPTYVNPTNGKAVERMQAASAAFGAAGCAGFWDCTASLCPSVFGGTCQPATSDGRRGATRGTCVSQAWW
jgi:subtilisin family serine protease